MDFIRVAKNIKVIACSLANNHSTDYLNGLAATVEVLEKNKISAFGTSQNPFIEYSIGKHQYIIWGLCSNLTEADFSDRKLRPQPLRPKSLLQQVKKMREKNLEKKIIIFIHWGYELSPFPQPADRELATRLIDYGADYVIGHHPHVIQPIEQYGRGLILYSLGNFALPQHSYRGRVLKYRNESVLSQLGLRITDEKISFLLMQYDKKESKILVTNEIFLEEMNSNGLRASFTGMDNISYKKWFRNVNQQHKHLPKLSPVFNSYFGLGWVDSLIKQGLLNFKWQTRKAAIKLGVHKPYNW